jgi:hypothetical protein
MRIGDARTQRDIANVLLDATGNAAELVSPDQLQEAAKAQREHERVQAIMRSGKEELPRSELTFGRHHINHEPTQEWYRVWGGAVDYSHTIDVFFVTESGLPLLLERVGSQAEHEKQQARRAERRAEREEAAKARRAQIRAQAR